MDPINSLKLDVEWVKHCDLVSEWSAKAAKAQYDCDVAKMLLDLAAANLDLNIRNNPNLYGVAKVTENAISNAILLQPEYASALGKHTDAKSRLNEAMSAMSELDHRKRAMTKLTDLWIRDYYSEMSQRIGGDLVGAYAMKRHAQEEGIDEGADGDE